MDFDPNERHFTNQVPSPPWNPNEQQNAAGRSLGETLGGLFRHAYMFALGFIATTSFQNHYRQNGGQVVESAKDAAKDTGRWLVWGTTAFFTLFYLLVGVVVPLGAMGTYIGETKRNAGVTGYELTAQPGVHTGTLVGTLIGYGLFWLLALGFTIPFCLGALYYRHTDSALFKRRRLYRWVSPFARAVQAWPSWLLYVLAFLGPICACSFVQGLIH